MKHMIFNCTEVFNICNLGNFEVIKKKLLTKAIKSYC